MRSLFLLIACLLLVHPAVAEGTDDSVAKITPAELSFLTGNWSGTDGSSVWETMYTSAEGDQIVGASKEFRGERVAMIDFEHFYVREGALRMTPYPFGKRGVEFTLTGFDAATRTAVFENPEHDFPKKFTYRAVGDDRLTVELVGQMGDSPVEIVVEFKRQ